MLVPRIPSRLQTLRYADCRFESKAGCITKYLLIIQIHTTRVSRLIDVAPLSIHVILEDTASCIQWWPFAWWVKLGFQPPISVSPNGHTNQFTLPSIFDSYLVVHSGIKNICGLVRRHSALESFFDRLEVGFFMPVTCSVRLKNKNLRISNPTGPGYVLSHHASP